MKATIIFFYFLFNYVLIFGQSAVKTMLRLPDTGETTSYTTTFGEDNDYIINPPFFLIQGNGTVIDTVTGLMWQQAAGGEMTIENAIIYCDTLTLGGYMDWRLPDAHESFSILNHQYANPALDVSVFTKDSAEYWWTSDRQANDSNKVWVTNKGGGIGNHLKTEARSAGGSKIIQVRAVRDISAPTLIPDHFTDNGNGTVTDNITNLIWQKVPFADTLNWEQALTYAATLFLAGNSEWRLPNIKELQSINDEGLINPSLNTSYFSAGTAKKYWSSTTLPNQTTKAWYLNTQYGITTYDEKTLKHYLICVRGNTGITATENLSNEPAITIFPNPATSEINITFNQTDNADSKHIEIADEKGQVVFKKVFSFSTRAYRINTSSFASGIYFITIAEKDILKTYKIMIGKE